MCEQEVVGASALDAMAKAGSDAAPLEIFPLRMAAPPTSEAPGEAALTEQLRHDLETLARERDEAFRALQEREAELARIQRIGEVGGVEVDFTEGFKNRRSPEYL